MPSPVLRPFTLTLLLLASLVTLSQGGCKPDAPPSDPTPDASTPDTPPDASTPPEPVVVHGLKGEYFRMSKEGAHDFAELGAVALDSNIEFSDLTATFRELTGRPEHTTARWTGQITAPETGDYTFHAIGDNGFRLFIDEKPVIDHWVGDWDKEQHSEPVSLVAGVPHTFRLEMFQDFGGANMYLRWQSATLARQIVPSTAFTPPADYEVYPVSLVVGADGRQLTLRFAEPITSLGELMPHLTVAADTTAMPLTAAAGVDNDAYRAVVTLGEPVQRGQKVRVSYDGAGGLVVGGNPVPQIIRDAVNESTHRLRTEWAEQVDTDNPLPEYPRPQQVRERWLSLNGPWEFSGAAADAQPVFGQTLPERIIVPYPVESQLSGLERHEDHMFYRRLFTVPAEWSIGSGQRLLLNFGAVDYHARVWVNGKQVAEHKGGYTAFSADITSAVTGSGQQELIVAVTDTTGANQPTGKQSRRPGGIFYTQSSGIWQTVWLEPVPTIAVDSFRITPDIKTETLTLEVRSGSATAAAVVTVEARDAQGNLASRISGAANTALKLSMPAARLWSPEDPYLYGLNITLTDGANTDAIKSYFGMRSVSVEKVGDYQKLVLNGKPVFTLAMLDQGFWPEGLNTAPTDEALRWDLQVQKDLGFNAVRKHIKVEPARWYFHADQIGLLLWQDFVSGDFSSTEGQQAFRNEGRQMMEQFHNSPSIVGWIIFNEGWGEWNREATGRIADEVKTEDPSRWINAHSGVNCCNSKGDSGRGDVIDHHDYNNTDPASPDARRAAIDGEHGGFVLRTPGHMWPGAPTVIYSNVPDKAALTAKYVSNTQTFYLAAARSELSGSIYTQVTDLENELNGLYTYDRRVLKVDLAAVRDINLRVIAAGAAAGTDPTYPGAGRWQLDEGTGTQGRDIEKNNDVNLHGDTRWVNGVSGKALRFDGNGDFAETSVPVVDTRGDYTLSAWVTLESVPGNFSTVVSQDGRRTENPFYLQYGQGAFAFSTPGGRRARLEMRPELNRWYHLVGVRSGSKARLYVDGVRATEIDAGAADTSTGPLSIGRAKYNGNNVDFWHGSIDEVQAFGRALSDSDVTTLYNSVQRP